MSDLGAQSPGPNNVQAEIEPGKDVVAPELLGVVPEPARFTEEELAEEIGASHIKVIWRGGVPVRVLLAVAMSLLINIGVGIAGFYLVTQGWFSDVSTKKPREYGTFISLPKQIEDGGSPGGIGDIGDGKQLAPEKGPPLEKILRESASADILSGEVNVGESAFAPSSGEKLSVIGLGTSAVRLPGKSKGGGLAKGGSSGGAGGAIGDGLGGSGNGTGANNGEGVDLGLSMDTQVRILNGPSLHVPEAYLSGAVKLEHSPLVRVWVRANNSVRDVEVMRSSGDAVFDRIVADHYRRQKYLAATVDGEPVEKFIDVSYRVTDEEKPS